jgi:hypothetical protein
MTGTNTDTLRRATTSCIALMASIVALSSTQAIAQTTPATAPATAPVQSVTSRERTRLEDNAHQIGAFLVNPQIAIGATYNDNIYATDTDKRGDVFLTVRPTIDVRSTWSRHGLNVSAYYDRDVHAEYTGEDVSQYGAAVDGRYDISRQTRAYLGIDVARSAETRGSLSSFLRSVEPVRFNSFIANGALEQDLGSLRLRGEGRFRRVTYGDAALPDGTILDQQFRNFDIYSGTLQASYDLNTLTSFVLRGTLEQRRYDLRPGDVGFDPLTSTDRSGNSSLLEIGVTREITTLLSGTVRIGYLRFRYPDPRLNDLDGISYYANINWNITPLTTVRAIAQRRVDETTSPITAGNLRDEVSISVDHELLRQVILHADARKGWINPSIADGVTTVLDTSSQETEFGIGARYYVGRKLRFDAGYTYQQRTSDNPLLAYVANVATIGVNVMF